MLAADAEVGRTRHAVDLFAHLVEGRVDAVALRFGIVGDRMFDRDARLVEHRDAGAHAVDQFLSIEPLRRLVGRRGVGAGGRSEEHTSELQSLMRISYAVFCLKKKTEK